MQCSLCLPQVQHDVLYRCNQCAKEFCRAHIDSHTCFNNMTQFIPSLFNSFQNQISVPRREPTAEEYENYLRANPQVLTSGRESIDLLIAMGLLFLVFGLRPLIFGYRSLQSVIILTIAIAPAFILHELAHKYAAIYYKKYARFTLIRQMTYITVLVAFLGFGVAGPGATMILGRSSKREKGIFSAAGPGLNFTLSVFFYLLVLLLPPISLGNGLTVAIFLKFSIYINSFLGLFNLIPVAMLDGKKIKDWNVTVWISLIILNLITFLYSQPVLVNISF